MFPRTFYPPVEVRRRVVSSQRPPGPDLFPASHTREDGLETTQDEDQDPHCAGSCLLAQVLARSGSEETREGTVGSVRPLGPTIDGENWA